MRQVHSMFFPLLRNIACKTDCNLSIATKENEFNFMRPVELITHRGQRSSTHCLKEGFHQISNHFCFGESCGVLLEVSLKSGESFDFKPENRIRSTIESKKLNLLGIDGFSNISVGELQSGDGFWNQGMSYFRNFQEDFTEQWYYVSILSVDDGAFLKATIDIDESKVTKQTKEILSEISNIFKIK